MAHRLRAQTRQATASSGTSAQGPGKRKRDALQDISEDHSTNGFGRHSSASSSGRRGPGHRRSSPMAPMAPARRSSVRVRRSRRLSEQQSSNSRNGANSGAAGASGTGGEAIGRGGGGSGASGSGIEEDDGGMSCDEELEGMVVDLSFEGVADDSSWRESDRQTTTTGPAPAVGSTSSTGHKDASNAKGSSADQVRGAETGSDHSIRNSISSNNHNSTVGSEAHAGPATRRARVRERAGNAATTAGAMPEGPPSGMSSFVDVKTERHGRAAGDVSRQDQRAPSAGSNTSSTSSGGSCPVHAQPGTEHGASATAGGMDGARQAGLQQDVMPSVAAETATRTPLPAGVEDIDAGAWDSEESHLQNPDYAVEHAMFLRTQERRNRPSAYIGSRQKDMRQSMRSVLVDWIVEVCDQFKLSSRTLFHVSGVCLDLGSRSGCCRALNNQREDLNFSLVKI